MSMTGNSIPTPILHWLERIPNDAPVALLMRHAERGPLPPGEVGDAVPITTAGERSARALGSLMGDRIQVMHSSPVPRCLQTAEAMLEGSSLALPIHSDRLLGDPGVFVVDGEKAWETWLERGHDAVVAYLETGDGHLPGLAAPGPAARTLVQHMMDTCTGKPGLHIFVTHDILVSTTVARMTGRAQAPHRWPPFLGGAFFWGEEDHVDLACRDIRRRVW